MPLEQFMAGMESEHPAAFFRKALELHNDGHSDEALVCYYVAQIRYRYYLKASDLQAPGQEASAFLAIDSAAGPPIVAHALLDNLKYAAALDAALDWDDSHPNLFLSKERDRRGLERIRRGLRKFQREVRRGKHESKR